MVGWLAIRQSGWCQDAETGRWGTTIRDFGVLQFSCLGRAEMDGSKWLIITIVLYFDIICIVHVLFMYVSYSLSIFIICIVHIISIYIYICYLSYIIFETWPTLFAGVFDENMSWRKRWRGKNRGIQPFPPAQVEEMCFPWIPCSDLMILKLSWNKLIHFHASGTSAIKKDITCFFFALMCFRHFCFIVGEFTFVLSLLKEHCAREGAIDK